jgi:hypothetical protein
VLGLRVCSNTPPGDTTPNRGSAGDSPA